MYKNLSIFSIVAILSSCKNQQANKNVQDNSSRAISPSLLPSKNIDTYNEAIDNFRAIDFKKLDDHFEQKLIWKSKKPVKLYINGKEVEVTGDFYNFKGELKQKYTAELKAGTESSKLILGEINIHDLIFRIVNNIEHATSDAFHAIVSHLEDYEHSFQDGVNKILDILKSKKSEIDKKAKGELKKIREEISTIIKNIKKEHHKIIESSKDKDLKKNIKLLDKNKDDIENKKKCSEKMFEKTDERLKTVEECKIRIKQLINDLDKTIDKEEMHRLIDIESKIKLINTEKADKKGKKLYEKFETINEGKIKIADMIQLFEELQNSEKYSQKYPYYSEHLKAIKDLLIKINDANTIKECDKDLKKLMNQYDQISHIFPHKNTIRIIEDAKKGNIIISPIAIDEFLVNKTLHLFDELAKCEKQTLESKISKEVIGNDKTNEATKNLENHLSYLETYRDIGVDFGLFDVTLPTGSFEKFITNIMEHVKKVLHISKTNQKDETYKIGVIGSAINNYKEHLKNSIAKSGWEKLIQFIDEEKKVLYDDIKILVEKATNLEKEIIAFFESKKDMAANEYGFKGEEDFDLMELKLKFLKIERMFEQEKSKITDSKQKEELQKNIDDMRVRIQNKTSKSTKRADTQIKVNKERIQSKTNLNSSQTNLSPVSSRNISKTS